MVDAPVMNALAGESIEETTSAGAVAAVVNPVAAHSKSSKKGRYGAPKAKQKTNSDGTAKNALDVDYNLMGSKPIKR